MENDMNYMIVIRSVRNFKLFFMYFVSLYILTEHICIFVSGNRLQCTFMFRKGTD